MEGLYEETTWAPTPLIFFNSNKAIADVLTFITLMNENPVYSVYIEPPNSNWMRYKRISNSN